MPFTVTVDHLAALFSSPNLSLPDEKIIFAGLRRCEARPLG